MEKPSSTLVIPRDSLLDFTGCSLFISSQVPDTGEAAFLFFFDPQAEGGKVIRHYRNLAKNHPFLLCASNFSRNGTDPELALRQAHQVVSDIKNKFPGLRLHLFLAGFSGAATLSSSFCQAMSAEGFIYVAAPSLAGLACPALGFAGISDPNYYRMKEINEALSREVPHCLKEWKGKHAWPDPASMDFAFRWIHAKLQGGKPAAALLAGTEKRLAGAKQLRMKEELLEELVFLASSLGLASNAADRLDALRKSAGFRKEKAIRKEAAERENAEMKYYQDAFFSKDGLWWDAALQSLRQENRNSFKHQRLLGYLSLLAYSASHRSMNSRNFREAGHFISLYLAIDPDNDEPYYLKAVLLAEQKQFDLSKSYLEKAVSHGFSDKNRMSAQVQFNGRGFESLLAR